MKKHLNLVILAVFALLAFSAFFWLYEAKYFISRASITIREFSPNNSYVFTAPLRAKASKSYQQPDISERIRVTIFVLDDRGVGVPGKNVVLSDNKDLYLQVISGITDNSGKAVFDVSSSQPGQFYLNVDVEGTTLPQQVQLQYD